MKTLDVFKGRCWWETEDLGSVPCLGAWLAGDDLPLSRELFRGWAASVLACRWAACAGACPSSAAEMILQGNK